MFFGTEQKGSILLSAIRILVNLLNDFRNTEIINTIFDNIASFYQKNIYRANCKEYESGRRYLYSDQSFHRY